MPKIRVHELAKKIDKTSNEIISFLQEKGIEKKAASALEDDQVEVVMKKFAAAEKKEVKSAAKKEKPAVKETSAASKEAKPAAEKKAKPTATQETKPEKSGEVPAMKAEKPAEASEQPVKKKNISQVFHPQNSQRRPGQDNRRGYNNNRNMNGKAVRPAQPANQEQSRRLDEKLQVKAPETKRPVVENRPVENKTPKPQTTTRQEKPFERKPESRLVQTEKAPHKDKKFSDDKENRFAGRENRPGNRDNRPGEKENHSGDSKNQSRQNAHTGDRDNRQAQGGNRMNQGNRTNQGGNRPNQGGNRPNQGGNRPNQGGNRPNQRNKGKRPQPQPQQQQPKQPEEDVIKTITIPESLTIKELADKMKLQPSVIVKKLFLQGKIVTVNQEIDFEAAEEIALEFNCIAEQEEKIDLVAELLKEEEEDTSNMVARPPVVCVMGHVDHGKTSLLDAIRDTHVIDREAGGITQHIGAYIVAINGQKITFLDTPGHEAFTAMRMRGANATDIAILVVAADDGVMPQTVEAINHAKAAGIEIIVAINKIDKPSANIERVKQELAEYELISEDWGGSTVFVPVSAHTHEGIDELLEMILLTAEVCELKANPKRKTRGLVIEAELDKGKGPVATVLVQKGTLKVGDSIAAGSCHGKVRAMMDDKGRRVKEAGPSTPVEILGLNDVPNAGEIFMALPNEKEARRFAEIFISQGKEKKLEETKSKMSLDDLFTQIQAGNLKELDIIVKADVQGSVEAVKQSLVKLSNDEVVVKVIHGGVGAINESDVILASASNAIIIGFNVRPDATAKETAEHEGVDLRLYKVIYNAIEDVEAAMKGLLDPVFEEKIIGHAEVRQIFKASGVGTIAGSYVLDGVFERGCSVRITREGEQIFDGPLDSLKRFKDDVKEVKTGYECGLVPEKFNDIKEGDLFEAYKMVEVPR